MSWTRIISELEQCGVVFEPGLSNVEVEIVENSFGFKFPPDLRAFLQSALPIDFFPTDDQATDQIDDQGSPRKTAARRGGDPPPQKIARRCTYGRAEDHGCQFHGSTAHRRDGCSKSTQNDYRLIRNRWERNICAVSGKTAGAIPG